MRVTTGRHDQGLLVGLTRGLPLQGCVEPDSFEGGSKSYCNMYQQVRAMQLGSS